MPIRPATVSAPVSFDVTANDRLYCTPIAQTSWVSYRPLTEPAAQAPQAPQLDPLGAAQHHRGLRRTVAVVFHREPPRISVQPPTPPPAPTVLGVGASSCAITRPASAPPVLQNKHVQALEPTRDALSSKSI